LRRHNLQLGWLFGFVKIEQEGDFCRASVGPHSIYLVNPNRWRRYRRGIPRQLRRLARTYGATDHAKEFPGKTVIDIGANIGEFTLFAANHGAEVIAIEPDRENLQVLQKNVGTRPVRIVQKAVWKETTRLPLYAAPLDADSGLIAAPTATATYEVEAARLDDITKELGVGEIFFIKADAEGAEPEVLMGAPETLARTRYVSFDCGPEREGESTVAGARALLEDAGFRVELLKRRRTIVFGTNMRFGRG
jgi:FkbM family methyltransferase